MESSMLTFEEVKLFSQLLYFEVNGIEVYM